ncbi:DivIVA domain-containing protein [Salicibibacter halophilus]|uniref:DivIVA domain-containing protein n=1 Tax=Salicibibacter halophilus TaxID=2502791 RepID=A0A514LFH2_9BACI|nr:DivIVA domain-containing protein [Salicibibacter halophilus]QDI90589.1 DivIVA domain-containing protein [Salicibibacter halophilus]
MSLTPVDIHNKQFTKSFRGYDEDEVNEFLDQVIKDFESTIRQKNELFEKVNELEDRLNHFSNMEETLNKSIYVAQESAEDIKRNANKESQLIIRESEKNADRIINDALAKSRKIALETEELKKQASVYRMRFRMLIESQLEMLNDEDWDKLADSMEEAEGDEEGTDEPTAEEAESR